MNYPILYRFLERFALGVLGFVILLPCRGQQSDTDPTAQAKGIYFEGFKPHRPANKQSAKDSKSVKYPEPRPEAISSKTDPEDRWRSGAQFHVVLLNAGYGKNVPTTYSFHDGDWFRFQFELNQDRYVYVLTRTVSIGQHVGQKGIGTEKLPPYKLLFPNDKTGANAGLIAGQRVTIPNGDVAFRMDSSPGTEELYLVMSPQPLDLPGYFDLRTGELKAEQSQDDKGGSTIPAQLDRDLAAFAANTDVSLGKGVNVESYSLSRVNTKPSLTKVELVHLPVEKR